MTGSLVQTLLVLLIVGGAAFYVGRRLWRTISAARASKGDGCGVGCGCEEGGSRPSAKSGSRPSALGSRRLPQDAPARQGVPRV